MNRIVFGSIDRSTLIDGVSGDVKDTTENTLTYRNGNRLARVDDLETTLQALCRRHRHGPDPAITEVLLNLKHQLGIHSIEIIVYLDRIIDLRQLLGGGEIGVYHRSDNLDDCSFVTHLILGPTR